MATTCGFKSHLPHNQKLAEYVGELFSKEKTMSKNNSKSKKKSKKEIEEFKYRKNRPIDIVITMFIAYVVTVYTLYMNNKYFNITGTRALTFAYGAGIFIILLISAYIIEYSILSYYGESEIKIYKDSKLFAMPEIWAFGFLIANYMAYILAASPVKKDAMLGTNGRDMGLGMMLVLTVTFIVLSRQAYTHPFVFILFFISSGIAYVTGVLQHFGLDPFYLRERVAAKQKEMFISMFGNINTFGVYICIAIPFAAALFILSEKRWVRVIAAVNLLLGSTSIITAKSDNVYLGLFTGFILLLYVSIYYKKLTEYLLSIMIILFGLTVLAFMNKALSGSQKHINGLALIIENPKVMTVISIAFVIVLAGAIAFRTINIEKYKEIQNTKFLIGLTIFFILSGIIVVVIGVKTGSEFFVFDDKWGTFRGYIWRRSFDLFKRGSLKQKLFGYGNESVNYYMTRYYYDEMVKITKRQYDNCHNEYLQYLVTTGLFGFVTYVGMIITGLVYMVKRIKGNALIAACAAGSIAYMTAGIVSLNTPITTPYFFVIMALGIGYARYRDQKYGVFSDK